MKNICPVCGFDGLDFKPYDEKGFGTFEICPCCGFEFGCDDFPIKKHLGSNGEKTGLQMAVFGFRKAQIRRKIGMQKINLKSLTRTI